MKNLARLLLFTLLAGCNSSSTSDSSSGNLSIVFTSSTLAARPLLRAGASCSVDTDAGGHEMGLCYTPLQIGGYFNEASLSKTGGGAPIRILGGGTDSGLAAVFKKSAFDLKTSPTIASGDDNIQDGGGTYDILTIRAQALEVAFVADTGNQVYHVRIPFAATPPSSSTVFSSCGLGGGLTDADTLGTLFGSVVAEAGDILVCIKAISTETCADTDYQWVSGTTLSSTRPATPKQLVGTYLKNSDACTDGATHPEVTWGSANLDILLGTAVTVSAEITAGVKTYTSGGTMGSKLTVTLDIGSAESLFVPTSALGSDLGAVTQAQVLAAIDSILFKPVYIKNRKTSSAAGTGDLTATATLTVSN